VLVRSIRVFALVINGIRGRLQVGRMIFGGGRVSRDFGHRFPLGKGVPNAGLLSELPTMRKASTYNFLHPKRLARPKRSNPVFFH
jgi:hypothetical protein